jgi:hypothetical protein
MSDNPFWNSACESDMSGSRPLTRDKVGQNALYESCGKYSNLSPCQISHFSGAPKYFSYFYSLLLIYLIGKRIEIHRGPFFSVAGPARLCLSPIQQAKPAHAVGFCGTLPNGPSASWSPPVSLTSLWAGNHYAPDPLTRPLCSNPSPFLCFGFAPLTGAILIDRPPSSRAPALPR